MKKKSRYLLKEQRSCLSGETAETFLSGIFNKKLASVLLKAAKIRPERQAGLSDERGAEQSGFCDPGVCDPGEGDKSL